MPWPIGVSEPALPVWRRLAVIGLGLIGSSVLRGCREHPGLVGSTVAFDADPAVRARVAELGIADRVAAELPEAVDGADAVMLASPVGTFSALATAMAPLLRSGTVVTDTGSTKQSVIRDLTAALPSTVHVVPAHPMAGTEFSGPDAGFASLFQDRYCLLTPLPQSDPDAVDRVAALWRGLGAKIELMDPAHHDRVVAVVSHLPHLIAFTICGTADDLADESRQQVMRFAAAGFRDFTRIAASDPVMWRDVFLNNREALLEMLARFTEDAQAMARAVRWGDAGYIEDKIGRGRAIRRRLIELNQA